MKYFIKLNALSVLYAFMLFIVIELPLNIYRISRISGLVVPNDKPAPVTGLIIIGAMIIYPFYIAMISIIASINFKSEAG
ncbi:hypothetical protein MHH60_14745 [Paenibacillus sp. FSL H7-0716]|uniref:Uncharacterized protein n=1 Tax=Paenibacillus odorifer TaxID=189426 RepID=A0A1R0YRV9_9BACL|nr:hypothetical protein [Paenibacillus odorifer]AWV33118.1 hypothetical protein CD191_11110 [Paenibacillus odorifer]OME09627.1 hypothetical protein BSK60_27725 [Paenibacillus odorifer]OME10394.1 hypothetical protein BSK47_30685 [Paenibacillus odorifer]